MEYGAEHAMKKVLQLYPDLKKVKIFGAYQYYYHSSLSGENLKAALDMKRNYLRIVKEKQIRIGHNWEWWRNCSLTSLRLELSSELRVTGLVG